jgi:hypothetical protein
MVQRKESEQQEQLPEAQSFPELSADLKTTGSELIYGLYDRPPVIESIFVAIQHVLAAFVGIVTPPLIICTSLGLDPTNTSFIISMSLELAGNKLRISRRNFGCRRHGDRRRKNARTSPGTYFRRLFLWRIYQCDSKPFSASVKQNCNADRVRNSGNADRTQSAQNGDYQHGRWNRRAAKQYIC